MKKILLHDLGPALDDACAAHLDGFAVTRDAASGPFDLVVRRAGGGGEFTACPVLDIQPGPQRLGSMLRAMARRLLVPALYLDDMPLAGWVFRPQEGRLENAAGESVDLTDREIDMLVHLARHGGGPVTREDLLRHVWGYQDGIDTHTLETHIHRLRRKMGAAAIVTDAGGYSLGADGADRVE